LLEVYEQILRPNAVTSADANNANVIGRDDKPRLYLQIIDDDESLPSSEEVTMTSVQKCACIIRAEIAAKASTL